MLSLKGKYLGAATKGKDKKFLVHQILTKDATGMQKIYDVADFESTLPPCEPGKPCEISVDVQVRRERLSIIYVG